MWPSVSYYMNRTKILRCATKENKKAALVLSMHGLISFVSDLHTVYGI